MTGVMQSIITTALVFLGLTFARPIRAEVLMGTIDDSFGGVQLNTGTD